MASQSSISTGPAKVRSLRVRAVRVPMDQPHRTAGGMISESPLVLCDITTDEGVTGHSITFTYTVAALKPTADLIANLAPLIEGQPLAPAAIEDTLAKRFRLLGTQGLVGMALAAIDMALWDAHARAQGVSLVRLRGGIERPIQAYGAVGYEGPADSARVAEDWAKREFRGVKAKIGYPTVQEDVAVIRAIRSAAGPDMAIMVDYNQCLTPAEAIARIRVLDEEGLTWVEEPTLAHDYRGHASIARECSTPIQCGENWWGIRDLQHALDVNASDYMMPEVMKIGGVTGWLRAAALAEAASVRVSTHLWPEISAQLLCLTPMAHWLEYADWWNPILDAPLRVEKGMAMVDGAAGTGVAWNENAVSRFAV
ncbi:MAG TPA: enolase C-terminal domain-like protein [Bryobacteraceae bacterium]|nr:enolase C-terminal domain-like protein [Bryobacteraceae bacterium]